MIFKQKRIGRINRKTRIRKKLFGTKDKPRLSVFKSAKHIYAQIIDDELARSLVFVSTLSKDVKSSLKSTRNIEAAKKVGEVLSEKALKLGITKVAFDRNGFLYHGRIKALADTAREKGLKF